MPAAGAQKFMKSETTIEILTPRCPLCGARRTLTVSREGYFLWLHGTLIQYALPELSLDDRERLISGTCRSCWGKLR